MCVSVCEYICVYVCMCVCVCVWGAYTAGYIIMIAYMRRYKWYKCVGYIIYNLYVCVG